MDKVNLYNTDGTIVGDIELTLKTINEPSIYESVKNYLTNQRQGNASAKTRAEVSGSGAKPWKQKGTGRARAGSKRSPVWRGGGVVFGPKPHSFKVKLPSRIKEKALIGAIADKAMSNLMVVVDSLFIERPKTSLMIKIFKGLGLNKPLVIIEKPDINVALSLRNIKGCHLSQAENLNAYQVLSHPQLLITKGALQKLQERLNDVG